MHRQYAKLVDDISADELLSTVDGLKIDGWRLVQILCIARDDGYELYYSFGGGYAMRSLKLDVKGRAAVPSVTPYYPAAFLYENEIRDLFGVMIERIEPDFAGKAYGVAADRPFAKASMRLVSSERQTAGPALSAAPRESEGEV